MQGPESDPCSPPRSRRSVCTAWWSCWLAVGRFFCLCWAPVADVFCRIARVYLGTYRSKKKAVQRAELVADLNAMVLAAAVILLLTSRGTFHKAEQDTNDRVWHSLLRDNLTAACTTLGRSEHRGNASYELSLNCTDTKNRQHIPEISINARNVTTFVHILQILDGCKAFEFAIGNFYTDTACRWKAGNASGLVNDLLELYPNASHLLVPSANYRLVGRNEKGDNCHPPLMGWGLLGTARTSCLPWNSEVCSARVEEDKKYQFSSPGIEIPPNGSIMRWVDNFNNGIYLGLRPNDVWEKCFSSLASWIDVTKGVLTSDILEGIWFNQVTSGSCPRDGYMRLGPGIKHLYHCIRGAEVGSMDMLTNEMTLAKSFAHPFAYFWCLSYDELFGVYVGIFGFFIAVVFATAVVLCTDVCSPMLRAGGKSWSGNASAADAHEAGASNEEGHNLSPGSLHAHASAVDTAGQEEAALTDVMNGGAREGEGENLEDLPHAHAPDASPSRQTHWSDVLDVVLRVLASVFLGTALSVVFIYLPEFGYEQKPPCSNFARR